MREQDRRIDDMSIAELCAPISAKVMPWCKRVQMSGDLLRSENLVRRDQRGGITAIRKRALKGGNVGGNNI